LMWDVGSQDRASRTLESMSASDLTTGWGARILSEKSSFYEPLNYNYGAVWPFLTGYFAAALYRHGYPLLGYGLVEANAEHLFDNALGCATELFSGALSIWPQEAVAHQGFSSGGFVLPFIEGMLGLGGDAAGKEAVFAPCFPPDWPEVTIENFRLGGEKFDLRFRREKRGVRLEVESRPENGFRMVFAPSFGPGTKVLAAGINGKSVDFKVTSSVRLSRPEVRFGLSGRDMVEIEFEPTIEVLPPAADSKVGDPDRTLKIIRVAREGNELKVLVEGLSGYAYFLWITYGELVRDVQGAELAGNRLEIRFPDEREPRFAQQEIIIKLQE
jgi:hypothetical protein